MADKITNAVLFMICKDLLPLSTAEHEGQEKRWSKCSNLVTTL